MMWFSWNPWHTPISSGVTGSQSFPAAISPAGRREEMDAAARESGDKNVYVPVYIGWM